jgi:hypothetical protein
VGQSNLPRGQSLFSFGDTDGKADQVRLQHVLGVTYHGGKLYVADTYNNKIKVVDIEQQTASTLVGDGKSGNTDSPARFDEPEGLSFAAGKLYVADTNNHSIRTIDLANGNAVSTLRIEGLKPPRAAKPPAMSFPNSQRVAVDSASIRPVDGVINVAVELALPAGWKINERAPLRYLLIAKGDSGPVDRTAIGKPVVLPADQRRNRVEIKLPVVDTKGKDQLELSLTCYYCREGAEGFCKVASVIWSVPITVSESADSAAIQLRHEFR